MIKKKLAKRKANKNCEFCEGKGWIWIDIFESPHGSGVHQEKDYCSCVKDKFIKEVNQRASRKVS